MKMKLYIFGAAWHADMSSRPGIALVDEQMSRTNHRRNSSKSGGRVTSREPRREIGKSLLEPLIAMQSVPYRREKECDNEIRYQCKNDKRGGSRQAEWLDYKNRLKKVHPEYKIDQGLRPPRATKSDQQRWKPRAARQRPHPP